jgi:antagonist of KipI
MSLHVLDPGPATFVVDHGRPRTRRLGVPVGGAADRWSLALGNALVGNPPDTPALEIALSGPVLRASCPLACVLYGAPFEMRGKPTRLRAGKTFTLDAGEELHIHGTRDGMRAYFCVHGGINSARILDSCSSLAPVRAGEVFECQPAVTGARFLTANAEWN